ncbi:MAG: hypothetical protein HFE39_07950 [Clostridiales bacterium]|jgi:hypothetical protein|nr:hypothetical protein [Clostridiales bacterium]
MKKFLSLIAVLALVAVTAVSAFAAGINADEKRVLDTIKAGVTVGGKNVTVPDNYLVQAENYLNTIDLTAEQADQVLAAVEEAKAYVLANNITSVDSMSNAQRQAILAYAQKAASVVGLKVTITGDKQVVITDATGKIVATFEAAIKVTGGQADFTNAIVIAVAVLGVLSAAVFATRKFHLVKE